MSVQFKAAVKSDAAGRLKGTYECTVERDGLHLMQKKQIALVIPRRTPATYLQSNQIAVDLASGRLVLAIAKFPAYQPRLARAVAAYLRGERELADGSEFKVEPYLLVPAALPLGIMILTRGGAIWGAAGGVIAAGCLAIAQIESLPRLVRLGLILLINVVTYGAIVALVMAVPPR